jgi:hypothetical protein
MPFEYGYTGAEKVHITERKPGYNPFFTTLCGQSCDPIARPEYSLPICGSCQRILKARQPTETKGGSR